jgi:hypothetical protein
MVGGWVGWEWPLECVCRWSEGAEGHGAGERNDGGQRGNVT